MKFSKHSKTQDFRIKCYRARKGFSPHCFFYHSNKSPQLKWMDGGVFKKRLQTQISPINKVQTVSGTMRAVQRYLHPSCCSVADHKHARLSIAGEDLLATLLSCCRRILNASYVKITFSWSKNFWRIEHYCDEKKPLNSRQRYHTTRPVILFKTIITNPVM